MVEHSDEVESLPADARLEFRFRPPLDPVVRDPDPDRSSPDSRSGASGLLIPAGLSTPDFCGLVLALSLPDLDPKNPNHEVLKEMRVVSLQDTYFLCPV